MTLSAPVWHPLSERQTLFWLDEQLFPDARYNEHVITVDLRGPLDAGRLVKAWERTVAELDAFAITIDNAEPRQAWTAPLIPLSLSSVGHEPNAARDWVRRRVSRSLWNRGRLWDAALLMCGSDHHVFYLAQHQIVFDPTSSVRVIERLAARYAGEAPASPRSLRSYLDVEASYRASPSAAADQAYWSKKLEERVPAIRPYGIARTDRSVVLHRRESESGPERTRKIAALAAAAPFRSPAGFRPHGIAFTTALAAFLARVTGNRELLLAVPFDTRPLGYERAVGPFTEPLFLRVDVEEDDTFAALARRLGAEVEESARHGRACISNRGLEFVALALLPELPTRFGDLEAEVRLEPAATLRGTDGVTGDFRDTLGLQVYENGPDRLSVAIDYHGATFPPEIQERAESQIWRVVDTMTADPNARVDVVDLPNGGPRPAERQRFGWGDDPGTPADLVTTIVAAAARRPDHRAVEAPDGSLTYAELERVTNQIAHRLMSLGVGRDTCVGISLPRGLGELGAMLGTLKAGGAYVPLDPGYPPERLRLIVEDAAPQVMIVHPRSPFTDRALLPAGTKLLVIATIDELAEGFEATAPDLPPVDRSQLAYVLFTSGSTGRPKGVEIPRGAFSNFLHSMARTPGMTENDRLLAVTTTSFDIAELELFLPLSVGATTVIVDRDTSADPRRLRQAIERNGITMMQATPASWRLLLEAGWKGNGKIRLLCGGEAMSPELAAKLTACCGELWNMYGPTETTVWSSLDRVEAGATRISIGRPIDRTQMYVLDAELKPVPTGVVGELYIGGDGLARGYRGRPDLTAERFVQNPEGPTGDRIYRTGDLARVLDDGRFECLGRIDHQVKIRGFRIELGEIESVLRAVPGVKEALVIADAREGGDPQLVAYWVGDAAIEELAAESRRKLPAYMVPSAFVPLESFPLTPSGKIDRKVLPRPQAAFAGHAPLHPPRNDVETRIAAIWSQVLGLPQVGVDQDFFSVGGNSVLAIQLRSRIEQEFGVELPLSTVLSDPTVERMAKLLEPGKDVRSSIVLLRQGGPLPPLFFIHDGEGEIIPYRNLALRLSPEHPVYGIQPQSRREHPMLHTRLGEMVDYYVNEVRKIQPHGPYMFAGLCTGGFIGFEMARRLTAAGESVPVVVVLDGAHANARRKSLAARRLQRFSASMQAEGEPSRSRTERVAAQLVVAGGKIRRLVRYEAKNQTSRLLNKVKVQVLRFCNDHGVAAPVFAQNVPARVVLTQMEEAYLTADLYGGEVVLYRATKADPTFEGTAIDDTPYIELFPDPMLGWKDKAGSVKVEDVPGGHSSMLVPPYVDVLAESIQMYIDAAMARARGGGARTQEAADDEAQVLPGVADEVDGQSWLAEG